MESLVNRGIIVVLPDKTKKYAPSSPESFLKFIEEKEENLKKLKNKLAELKKLYDVKEKNPVISAAGSKGFYKILGEMSLAKKYTYNIKWTSEYRGDWVKLRKDKLKKGHDIKELVRYDEETTENVKDWVKISKNIKKIDNEGVALSVIDDEEVMISLIKSNVTLLIRDKPFAKIMKKMFLATYEKAEKID